jgi:universal stress protein E
MKRGWKRILVAVRDLDEIGALPAKAAALAAPGARMELFHALSGPVSLPVDGSRRATVSLRQGMQRIADHATGRLQRVAAARPLRGRKVSVHVTWDFPAADAIVRRALAIRADLIVAGVQPRRFAGRLLLVNTDWELIRESPCALLLTHPVGRYGRGAIVAAVDPFHVNDKPARLDGRLLAAARNAAGALGGAVHVFHAYPPLAALVAAASIQAIPIFVPDESEAEYARRIRRKVDALVRRAGIPETRRHVEPGDVAARLAALVRRTRADLVVMGALSRSGLKRAFIGNTAERVVDRLPSDLLVVKPASFTTRVPRRPRIRR